MGPPPVGLLLAANKCEIPHMCNPPAPRATAAPAPAEVGGTDLTLPEPRIARPRDGDQTILQHSLCQPNPKEAGTALHPHQIASPCGRSGDARRPAVAASRGWENHHGYDPDNSQTWCRWLLCGMKHSLATPQANVYSRRSDQPLYIMNDRTIVMNGRTYAPSHTRPA